MFPAGKNRYKMEPKQLTSFFSTIEKDYDDISILIGFLQNSTKPVKDKIIYYIRHFKKYEQACSRLLFRSSIILNKNPNDISTRNILNKTLLGEQIVKKFQYTVINPLIKKDPTAFYHNRKISASLYKHLAFIANTEYLKIDGKLFQDSMSARSILKNTASKTPAQITQLEKLMIDIKNKQLAQIPLGQKKASANHLFLSRLGLNPNSVANMTEIIFRNSSSVKNYLMQQQKSPNNLRDLFNIKSNTSFPISKLIPCVAKLFYYLSPEFSQLITYFFQNDYIELRSGPYPGGWHIGCPSLRQSRIFLSVQNSLTDVFNLSHELGHAYASFQQSKTDCNSANLATIEYGSIFCELFSYDKMSNLFPEYAVEIQKLLKIRLLKYVFIPLEQYLFENYLFTFLQKGKKQPDFTELTTKTWQRIFNNSDVHFTDITDRHTQTPQYFSVHPFYSLSYLYSFLAAHYSLKKLQEDKKFIKKINEICSFLGYLTIPKMYDMLGIDINSSALCEDIIHSITKD